MYKLIKIRHKHENREGTFSSGFGAAHYLKK
jgi:hypothetical protein